jgi:hypothetical protein
MADEKPDTSDGPAPAAPTTSAVEKPARIPIWHSPAWITAIVALVSVFITVPDILGNYLTKLQDVELAKQATLAAAVENRASKQKQEFEIVNNTLAQQGPERVFVLRYLSFTLDDKEANKWAKAEVERLDDLSAKQEKLDIARREFEKNEKVLSKKIEQGGQNVSALKADLEKLQTAFDAKNSQVEQLRQEAGISLSKSPRVFLVIRVEKIGASENEESVAFVNIGAWGVPCIFDEKTYCQLLHGAEPPSTFTIEPRGALNLKDIASVSLTEFRETKFLGLDTFSSVTVDYSCSMMGGFYVCNYDLENFLKRRN